MALVILRDQEWRGMLLDGNVGIIIVVNVNGGWMERWMDSLELVLLSLLPPFYPHYHPASQQNKTLFSLSWPTVHYTQS
jgi:hypothetical protein